MSKSRRPPRDVEDLKIAAAHVGYEIRVMIEAAERIPRVNLYTSPAAVVDDDIALESFLLHFRNLRVFLCPGLQRWISHRDILASDFLGRDQPENVADPRVLGQEKKKIDALLAHISYDRADYVRAGNKGWPVQRMLDDMVGSLASFIDSLPEERRRWFLNSTFLEGALSKARALGISEHVTTTTITVKQWLANDDNGS